MPRKKKQDPSALEKKSTDIILEISWEVCNQVGGIYTVIRSKVPAMTEKWRDRYFLIGPYFPQNALSEFEEETDADNPVALAVKKMASHGVEAFYGRWLVTGSPRVVLFNVFSVFPRLAEIKYFYWEHHAIQLPLNDELLNQALAFGHCVHLFLSLLSKEKAVLAHFHEWLSAAAVPKIRREKIGVKIVFTTHATLLGRYCATQSPGFYEHLSGMDWEREARRFNIEARVRLERACAHGAHCFTTVSEVTARECLQFLGKNADVITPNGLNIERFVALHEFQNLHREYKNKIIRFVMGHFFPSYSFDLDKTIFFFTSGRYEYRNKGFDLTCEALKRLNRLMLAVKSNETVVMFFITKQPFYSINPEVMQSRALIEEIGNTCSAMLKQAEERLLSDITARKESQLPSLNDFIDDYWKLRLKRTLASWKTNRLPIVVTHNLKDDAHDEILVYLRNNNLLNSIHDRVKIVYHPDFIEPTNPLFAMEYGQFVRGCHLGIFPSYYEPWGYTPLECVANGIPAVTSDLSGFGDYVMRTMPDHDKNGIWVVKRRMNSFDQSADELAKILFAFTEMTRRERIAQRNAVESRSEDFDWHRLLAYYDQAYDSARQA